MIYELNKRGYEYKEEDLGIMTFGLGIEVRRSNMKNITKEEINKMLNDFSECNYVKLSDKKYMAYIFFKDYIDGNENFRKFLMNIIFYLTDNYSSENCEKMEEFFQNESGYYLIIENIEYDEPPKNTFDLEFIKTYFNQINKELDRRHKFELYDLVFSDEDLGIKYLDEKKSKFRVIFKFQNFIRNINFRFRNICKGGQLRTMNNMEILNDDNNKKTKNEIYNLGKIMLKFIGKNKLKKGDNLNNLLISIFKEKLEERISWEEYINHPFFKKNNINADSYKYKEIAHIQVYNRHIISIIIFKNNFILLRDLNDNLYLLAENFKKFQISDPIKGDYFVLLNDELFLMDEKDKDQLHIYKLKKNVDFSDLIKNKIDKINFNFFSERIQTIDTNFEMIDQSYDKKDIIILNKNNIITFWGKENKDSKYIMKSSIKFDEEIMGFLEIKPKTFAIFIKKEGAQRKVYTINFYDITNPDNLVKKGCVQNLEEFSRLCMMNERYLACGNRSNSLKIIDCYTYKLVDKIMMEVTTFHMFTNKYGRTLVGIFHEKEYSYFNSLKEYTYEEGKLVRTNTIEGINPFSMAEGGDNLVAFGMSDGSIHIYKYE